jgi:hypothetical protein
MNIAAWIKRDAVVMERLPNPMGGRVKINDERRMIRAPVWAAGLLVAGYEIKRSALRMG